MIVLAALAAAALGLSAFGAGGSFALGNTDLNIRNGGVMLSGDPDCLYFFEDGGLRRLQNGQETLLCADAGKNLNLWGDTLYYTKAAQVYALPRQGGEPRAVYRHEADIGQLYATGEDRFLLLSGGAVYEVQDGVSNKISAPGGVSGLIPTPFGNLCLTGRALDWEVYAGDRLVLSGVTDCYVDGEDLAVYRDGQNFKIALADLFSGDFPALEPRISLAALAEPTYTEDYYLEAELTEGQINIIKRARQLHEIAWTPLEDVIQWGRKGVYQAGTTYYGLPYGQPVKTGYAGWDISLERYLDAVSDNTSKFYTDISTYSQAAPYYSMDCSGFVSYAWDLPSRKTTASLPAAAELVGDQSIYGIQVGDALNNVISHVVLVTAVGYNGAGEIVRVDVMEQTPVITRYTRYGEGGTSSLARFQSYYLGSGYKIYRNPNRDEVTYTHSCAVPIDGDSCPDCAAAAPTAKSQGFVGGKTVTLFSEYGNGAIRYTTDGSEPTGRSSRYEEPIRVTQATVIRAIALAEEFGGSKELRYTVSIEKAAAPVYSLVSGAAYKQLVASGSQIALTTGSYGASVYYTTDGSAPTVKSKTYSEPITVTKDMTIRAFASAPGMSDSDVAEIRLTVAREYAISAKCGVGGTISPAGTVRAMETSQAAFTITPDEGYAVAAVTVDGVSVGVVSSYTFKDLAADHSIEIKFRLKSGMPFADVAPAAWYYDAVGFAYANGLFNGTSETAFSPDVSMTRGMFVTVLGRLAGVPADLGETPGMVNGSDVRIRVSPNTECEILAVADKYAYVSVLGEESGWYEVQYGDVRGYIRGDLIRVYAGNAKDLNAGAWYAPYVRWAYMTDIIGGTAGENFRAEENISREDMCVLLHNYTKLIGKNLPLTADRARFSDDGKISSYASQAIYALQRAGIINGMGDGSFAPKGTATRAQVSQIFMNYLRAVK